MSKTRFFIWTVLIYDAALATAVSLSDAHCDVTALASAKHSFGFSVRSTRNESGEWNTKVEGLSDADNRTETVIMDFNHRISDCNGRQIFHFQGSFGAMNPEDRPGRLTFFPKCGKNAAITNNGNTVHKINPEERFHGVVFTNRPLRPNELFEVAVDKRTGSKFGYFMGIGVTTTTPHDGDIVNHINAMMPSTWVMYHNNVYHNGQHVMSNRPNHLDQLKVGDRVGVKVNNSGTLFLIVNGRVDAVASNVSTNVYGVYECYGDFSQVTIT